MGGGFEPPKASPTDLQSVPFDHSGTPPIVTFTLKRPWLNGCRKHGMPAVTSGASEGIRTPGLLITNQLLYQLSYAGLTT